MSKKTLGRWKGTKFHLDVLPAIPDAYHDLLHLAVDVGFAQHAIQITDRKVWHLGLPWPKSNPRGYTEWFKGRMRFSLQRALPGVVG